MGHACQSLGQAVGRGIDWPRDDDDRLGTVLVEQQATQPEAVRLALEEGRQGIITETAESALSL